MSSENYFNKLREDASFSGNKEKAAASLKRFDENSDGALDPDEFHSLCQQLFVKDGENSSLDKTLSRKIFDQLDENKDGQIDAEEFHILWKYWLPLVLIPKSALVIVDVQNDFITGSLPVPAAEEVIPVINQILDDVEFEHVFYTFDWHPEDHVSFHENVSKRDLHHTSQIQKEHAKVYDTVVFDGPVPMEQTLWPTHCVQESSGAHLHCDLKVIDKHTKIYKGSCNHIDSYSAFFDNQRLTQTELTKELCSRRVTDVYTCGLAFDVCVRHTSIDAAHLGFRTFVVDDACKSISEESYKKMSRDMEVAGCLIISSSEVKSMVTGRTRDAQMGLKAAQNVAEARRKAKDKIAKSKSNTTEKKSESAEKQPVKTNGSENVENVTLLDL